MSKGNTNQHRFYDVTGATYEGSIEMMNIDLGGKPTPYLQGLINDSDYIEFEIDIVETGIYHLNFHSSGIGGEKINNLYIDELFISEVISTEGSFADALVRYVYLEEGPHKVKLKKNWGHIALKGLEVMKVTPLDKKIYDVESNLINQNATDEAKKLMHYITDQYGEKIISGQSSNGGYNGREFTAIKKESKGKVPAILGLDFIDESSSRKKRIVGPPVIQYAEEFHQLGGIVTFMWHWNAPDKYLYDDTEHPWWSGFYTEHSTIDLEKIMNKEDEEGYAILIQEMDDIAEELKILQDKDIPVLWRPLHEASGGWFWWGNSGSEPFIKLWKVMYERFTEVHQLNNLIWVWNGQGKEWYPGDAYVDIIGEDIYTDKHAYSSQSERFTQAVEYSDQRKVVALTENGVIPDPDNLFLENILWSYFTTWNDEFVIDDSGDYSEEYTEKEMLKKVYNHPKVITLKELPKLYD